MRLETCILTWALFPCIPSIIAINKEHTNYECHNTDNNFHTKSSTYLSDLEGWLPWTILPHTCTHLSHLYYLDLIEWKVSIFRFYSVGQRRSWENATAVCFICFKGMFVLIRILCYLIYLRKELWGKREKVREGYREKRKRGIETG